MKISEVRFVMIFLLVTTAKTNEGENNETQFEGECPEHCQNCSITMNSENKNVECIECDEGFQLFHSSEEKEECLSKRLNCRYYSDENEECQACNSNYDIQDGGYCTEFEPRFSKGTVIFIFLVLFFSFVGLSLKIILSSNDTYVFLRKMRDKLRRRKKDSSEEKKEIGGQFLKKITNYLKKGSEASQKNSKKGSSVNSNLRNFNKMMKMGMIKSKRSIKNRNKKKRKDMLEERKRKPLTPFGQILKEFREKKEQEKEQAEKNLTPFGHILKDFREKKKKGMSKKSKFGTMITPKSTKDMKKKHSVNFLQSSSFSPRSKQFLEANSSGSKGTPPNESSVFNGRGIGKKKSIFSNGNKDSSNNKNKRGILSKRAGRYGRR